MTFEAADGARLDADPPFPPSAPARCSSTCAATAWSGVLLVRLGGHAAGVFPGARLVDSKVGSRLVHGRHQAGGRARSASRAAARGRRGWRSRRPPTSAARVLLPHRADLDALVLGGDRRALDEVLEDPRLRPLRALTGERVLDVPDPRLAVLKTMPDRFRATRLTVSVTIRRQPTAADRADDDDEPAQRHRGQPAAVDAAHLPADRGADRRARGGLPRDVRDEYEDDRGDEVHEPGEHVLDRVEPLQLLVEEDPEEGHQQHALGGAEVAAVDARERR